MLRAKIPTLCDRLLSNTLMVSTLDRWVSTLGLVGAIARRAKSSVNSERSSNEVSSICCQRTVGLVASGSNGFGGESRDGVVESGGGGGMGG